MPDKFQAELAAALSKRKSLDESPFDELDDLLGKKKPNGPSGRKAPSKGLKSSMEDHFDDFFNVNKDPVSELSKKKKTILDSDSDSDTSVAAPSFMKKATLSDSDESIDEESVYSDDDFEKDSIDGADDDAASTVKSVSSEKSIKSVKSNLTSEKKKMPETSIATMKDKCDEGSGKVEEPEVIETVFSDLTIEAKPELEIEAPTKPAIDRLIIAAEVKASIDTKPTGDPAKTQVLGKRLQKVVQSRRQGSKSKLPVNYTGLGSTAALEDLERFNANGLNLELQGSRGKRKELYLKWLAEKETKRQAEMSMTKTKTKEINKQKQEELLEKQVERDAVRKAWDQRKKEHAIKKARVTKTAEAEKKRSEEEKAAEKEASEKMVAKYRERKKAEMAERKKREREKQLEAEQSKNEQLQERRIQSARARTKWQKTRAKQSQEEKRRQAELNKQSANIKEMSFDKKHAEARRSYEEWRRRKQIEEKEKQRWGSDDDLEYHAKQKPFF